MELVFVLIFLSIVLLFAFSILLFSKLLSRKMAKRKKVQQSIAANPDIAVQKTKSLKFNTNTFLLAAVFLLLLTQLVLMLSWLLFYKTAENKPILHIEFIFIMALFVAGYVYIMLSKAINWKR